MNSFDAAQAHARIVMVVRAVQCSAVQLSVHCEFERLPVSLLVSVSWIGGAHVGVCGSVGLLSRTHVNIDEQNVLLR